MFQKKDRLVKKVLEVRKEILEIPLIKINYAIENFAKDDSDKENMHNLYKQLETLINQSYEGDAGVLYSLVSLLIRLNPEHALYFLERLANQGKNVAQYMLAHEYYFGDIIEKDLEKAFYWVQKAAEQNNPEALNHLGMFYLEGSVVEQDYQKAFSLIMRAAEMDFEYAFEGLAHCYYFGLGIKEDHEKAKFWWSKASDRGVEVATEQLEKYFGER